MSNELEMMFEFIKKSLEETATEKEIETLTVTITFDHDTKTYTWGFENVSE